MLQHSTRYGISTTVPLSFDQALARTREALAGEGFGVLTEIDVTATLRKKLDVEFRPYIILGACNPPLAHRALQAELDIGLLLPCNVVVYSADDPARTVVAALDPVEALSLSGNEAVRPIAEEVRSRLQRVVASVGGPVKPSDSSPITGPPSTPRSTVSNKRRLSAETAWQVGTALGIDWRSTELEQFHRGLEVELEHGARDPETNVTNDDLGLTGKIAWAHLKEFPDYYARLDKLEAEADAYWASRR
jgi:uncharacterized protein (DUF302 family)